MYTSLHFIPYLFNDPTAFLPTDFDLTPEQRDFLIHHYKMTYVLSQFKMTYVLNDINSGLAEHLWRMASLTKEIPYGAARAFGGFWRVRHYWVPTGYEVQSRNEHFRYSNEYLSNLIEGTIYRPTYIESYAYEPNHVIPSGRRDQVTRMKMALAQSQLETLDQQMNRNADSIISHLEL